MTEVASVTWCDGCLGVHWKETLCSQAQVSGYRIMLSLNDKLYTYHTSRSAPEAAPGIAIDFLKLSDDAEWVRP